MYVYTYIYETHVNRVYIYVNETHVNNQYKYATHRQVQDQVAPTLILSLSKQYKQNDKCSHAKCIQLSHQIWHSKREEFETWLHKNITETDTDRGTDTDSDSDSD